MKKLLFPLLLLLTSYCYGQTLCYSQVKTVTKVSLSNEVVLGEYINESGTICVNDSLLTLVIVSDKFVDTLTYTLNMYDDFNPNYKRMGTSENVIVLTPRFLSVSSLVDIKYYYIKRR